MLKAHGLLGGASMSPLHLTPGILNIHLPAQYPPSHSGMVSICQGLIDRNLMPP